MSILVFLVFVAIAAAVVVSAYGAKQERLRVVADELRALGAAPVSAGNAVMGSAGGMAVTYELRPGGKNVPSRTFCTALIPPDCPRLEMDLRPQTTGELRHVEKGRAIDLILGDDAFDDAFIVEAAPSEVARAILDEPIRAALLTFWPCRLTVAARELCFDKGGFIEQPGEVKRLLEMCVGACARLAALSTEMQEQQIELARSGGLGGYRGIAPDGLRALDRTSGFEVELAALDAARARRRRWRQQRLALAFAVLLAGVVVWARLAGCGRS
jgi:hypothetical protein